MILLLALGIMLIVAYAHSQDGLFNATAICFGVLFSGVVAFNYWPPTADVLEDFMAGGMLDGCEDAVALIALFCGTLAIVRAILTQLAPTDVDVPAAVDQIGGGVVGLVSGYLVSGFLICALQTLPWHENFLGFEPRPNPEWSRRMMPADEFWLRSLLHFHRTSLRVSAKKEDRLDRYFTDFEYDFAKHRRITEERGPLPWPPPPPPEGEKKDAPPPPPTKPEDVKQKLEISPPPTK